MAIRTETDPFDPGVVPAAPAPAPAATNMFSGGAGAPSQEPMVFVGYQDYTRYNAGRDEPVTDKRPRFMPISQFIAGMSSMDREEFLKLRNLLIAAGVVGTTASFLDVEAAMEQIAVRTATSSSRMSPLGYVKNLARMNGFDPGEIGSDPDFGGESQDLFTGKQTQTSRSISEITEGQAWASIQGTLQQMLGRDPTDQELRDFTYRMNRMAADNPTITRTIQQYKDGELDSTTSRTRGGFTAADMAQEAYDQAQNDPEYAEFQAATTYFSALQSALGAIGG